jgi:hypothetical protein
VIHQITRYTPRNTPPQITGHTPPKTPPCHTLMLTHSGPAVKRTICTLRPHIEHPGRTANTVCPCLSLSTHYKLSPQQYLHTAQRSLHSGSQETHLETPHAQCRVAHSLSLWTQDAPAGAQVETVGARRACLTPLPAASPGRVLPLRPSFLALPFPSICPLRPSALRPWPCGPKRALTEPAEQKG